LRFQQRQQGTPMKGFFHSCCKSVPCVLGVFVCVCVYYVCMGLYWIVLDCIVVGL